MNHKQLLALFLCLVIITSSKIVSKNDDIVEVKDVSSNIDKYYIENIAEEDSEKKINAFYPVTKYSNVNEYIKNKVDMYINEFNNSNYIVDKKTLEISFEEYEYLDYTSFKFDVKSNVGISHDTESIFTVVYKGNTIVDIDSLLKSNNDLLGILYDECSTSLKENANIKQYSNEEWLANGLEEKSENYKCFILTPESFVVIFNEYTVAPYVAGILEVEISYDKLEGILE